MNTAVKVGLWGTAIVGLFWIGKKVSETYDVAKYALPTLKIIDFGIPRLSSNVLSFPLKLQIDNPTPTSVTIDSVFVQLYILRNKTYEKAGVAQVNDLVIAPGKTTREFNAEIDMGTVASKPFDLISTALLNKSVDLKFEIDAVVGGYSVPTQTVTKNISIV